MNNIYKLIQDELYIIIEYTMKNYGLRNSDVAKDARVQFNDTLFSLVFPDYITYINSGRKPNSKMPPTEAIVEWCRSKGIPTDNNTVWKIRQGIARQGIAARPVIDSIMELAQNEWDRDWSQKVFNEIISELINWFQK